jgi:flagellar biogenesis protein FliO
MEQAMMIERTGILARCRFSLQQLFRALFHAMHVQQSTAASLRIEEKLSLGPKKMLFLVKCSGKEFLVATGAETITSVVEVSQARQRETRAWKQAGGRSRRKGKGL